MQYSNNSQRPALLNLQQVADFLGQPVGAVRRWIHKPPVGFPGLVRIGAKITVRTAELEAWAAGGFPSVQAAPPITIHPPPRDPAARPRGRPRKQPVSNTFVAS